MMHAHSYRTAVSAAALTTFALLLAGPALAVTITSIAPVNALADTPGQCPAGLVTITGTGFANDGPTSSVVVKFNGTAASISQVGSDTTIYARVPAGATDGPISVTTAAGTATSTTNFQVIPCYSTPAYANPPSVAVKASAAKASISGFVPAQAKVGAKVTISGRGFTGATVVKIGGVKATFKVGSSTKITATVPARAKTGRISVTTAAGTSTSAKSIKIA
jgi:hypothetical protein